jgi:hypothetical protein
MAKLARKRQEASGRKTQRMADRGREFEDEVGGLLQKMQDEELIIGFVAHAPNSTDDQAGRDFTVMTMFNGKEVSKSFGVTISMRHWHDSKVKHPDIPQFCFPLGTKPETIRTRILELFSSKAR